MTRGRVLTLGAVVLAVATTASVLAFPDLAEWLRDATTGRDETGLAAPTPPDGPPDPRTLTRADGSPLFDLTSFEHNPDLGVVAADEDAGVAYSFRGGTWSAQDVDGNRWRVGTVAGRFVPTDGGGYEFHPAQDLGADTEEWVEDHLASDPVITADDSSIRIEPRPAFDEDAETAARATVVPGGTFVPDGDELVVVKDRETRHVWVEDVDGGQLVFDRASVTIYRDGIIEAADDGALPTVNEATEAVAAIVLDAGAAVVASAPDLTGAQTDWLDGVLGTLPDLERGDTGWEVVPVAPVLARPTRDDIEWRSGDQGPELFIDGELAGLVVRTNDGWFTFLPRPNLSQVAHDLAMDVFRRTPGVGPYALALEEERAAQEEAARLEAERAAAAMAGEDLEPREPRCRRYVDLLFEKYCVEWAWNPVAGAMGATADWATDQLGDTRDLAVDTAGDIAAGAQRAGRWVEAEGRASIDYAGDKLERLADGTVQLAEAGAREAQELAADVKDAYDDTMTWIGTLGERSCGQLGPGPNGDGSGAPRDRPADYAPSPDRIEEWELARAWMPMLKLSPEERCGEIIRIVARVVPYGPDGEQVEDLGAASTAEVIYTVFFREDGGRFGALLGGIAEETKGHPGDNEGMVVALARTVLRSGRCTTGFELVEARSRSHQAGWGGFGPVSEVTASYEDDRAAAEAGKCPRLGPGFHVATRIDPAPRGDPDEPFSVYVAESKHALWFDEDACEDALLGVEVPGVDSPVGGGVGLGGFPGIHGGIEECGDGRDPYDLGNWVELFEDAGPCVEPAAGEVARAPAGGWPPAGETYLHKDVHKDFYCQTRGSPDDSYHSPALREALAAAPPDPGDDAEEPDPDGTEEPDDAESDQPDPDPDPSPPPSTGGPTITAFSVSRSQIHEDATPACGPTTAGLTVTAEGPSGVDDVRVHWQVGSDRGTTELSPASGGAWSGSIGPFGPATLSGGSAAVDLTAVATGGDGEASATATVTLVDCEPERDFPPQWTSDHTSVAVTPSRSDAASGHGGSYTVGETVTLCYSWDWSPEVRVYLLAWQDQPYSSSGEVSGSPAVLDARTEGEPGNSCGSVAVPSPGGYHVFGVELRDASTSCEGGSGTRCGSLLAEARIWIWVDD